MAVPCFCYHEASNTMTQASDEDEDERKEGDQHDPLLLYETVVRIVHQALVGVCGRESSIQQEEQPHDDSLDDDDVQQWRHELEQLVRRTVTVRARNSRAYRQLFRQAARCKMYDIEVRTAAAYFQRYNHQTPPTPTQPPTSTVPSPPPGTTTAATTTTDRTIEVVSELGVVRTLPSAYHLAADWLLPPIEDACRQSGLSHHVRVAQSGFIGIATVDLVKDIRQQQQAPQQQQPSAGGGWEPCPRCPLWCRGAKGLWWHLQQQHAQLHATAAEWATYQNQRDATAMVVYQGGIGGDDGDGAADLFKLATTSSTSTTSSSFSRNHDKNGSSVDELQSARSEKRLVGDETANAGKLSPSSTSSSSISAAAASHPPPSEDPWTCVQRGGTLAELKAALAAAASSSSVPFDCTTARDRHGAPLLLWAAGGGHLPLVRYLVEECGCDPDAPQTGKRAFGGRTALHWAARKGHAAIVEYLLSLRLPSSSTSGKSSEEEDHHETEDCTNATTTARRRMEAATADGTTAFGWAAWQAHTQVLELLHRRGCRVDARNQFGCNAVLWAAQGKGDPSTIQWLERVGCCTWAVNHSGHGLLHKAAQRGRRDLCEWFVRERLFPWLLKQQQQQQQPILRREGSKNSKSDDDDDDNDDSVTMLHVFRLIGPDNDGCTPSDLAGMEDHRELAIYLAQQEMALVAAALQASSLPFATTATNDTDGASKFRPPEWLLNGIRSASITKIATPGQQEQLVWEPWAGVFRMRSVLPQ